MYKLMKFVGCFKVL